jgi:uncharacterized protein YbjT (DUF2867 family)
MNAVTGALSLTGRAIAEELLRRGERVVSLSRRDDPADPLRARVSVRPLFADSSLRIRRRLPLFLELRRNFRGQE